MKTKLFAMFISATLLTVCLPCGAASAAEADALPSIVENGSVPAADEDVRPAVAMTISTVENDDVLVVEETTTTVIVEEPAFVIEEKPAPVVAEEVPVAEQTEGIPGRKRMVIVDEQAREITYGPLTLLECQDMLLVVDCDEDVVEVVIPFTLNNKPVKMVMEDAFDGCTELTTLTIYNALTTIDVGAFDECKALTDLHYYGTAEDRDQFVVWGNNAPLYQAEWHYDLRGDVNNDGELNNRDLALVQQYLNAWDVVIHRANCDMNGDGEINNRDLALLQRQLNGERFINDSTQFNDGEFLGWS